MERSKKEQKGETMKVGEGVNGCWGKKNFKGEMFYIYFI